MRTSSSVGLAACLFSLLACACATKHPPPSPAHPIPRSQAPSALPAVGLYPAEEALRDVLSGPWEYLGTGPWHSTERTHACAFRNQRVIVVNVYCTLEDTQAFRVEVFSPQRGMTRIYAESRGAVSAGLRPDYFTFKAESEPPPRPEARLPALSLGMSFQQLSDYNERRYAAYLPACYAGTKFNQQESGCLGSLSARSHEWTARNQAFLEHASSDWYHLVHEMRALATRYGMEPK